MIKKDILRREMRRIVREWRVREQFGKYESNGQTTLRKVITERKRARGKTKGSERRKRARKNDEERKKKVRGEVHER